ncbi:MAG: hypothetical protein A3B74_02350 [Candidatus Kerfeldbacteria bacterium RIFCSPHIGHO2_02_FULL_42_14]|uniref:Segregation and condensation protein A n=1 Tax=Candidatus Kerfeldbacteria bacterium RIFCSPHIGHO2_02_FULL_42_14 TaxID=1798540 RepID=A0A1G2ARQ6_9BACT|nr:MAG: hypothetical protein A3B74_02350 [Candidatus Kerfeldbacteria bacterium RIFCSPHIGHO2_02_FULL_42_14]OGY80388.1 MAG: hypothetical protein A3E60_04970 [Candidatus Kerfeldbacteria bacterium RIFCSPHIGHO2_12_FULL_42_13]OGY83817.1 MAG: hypothetical protein A3I91_04495 [Candidatus Kerfeldbacteria bacterium RIFCSPLOWO2_02_FULL_42_19]OGY85409.1 MAG: hypothetical protein A3G01_02370 [Candidatus Kerfeldbacteria bacterium RIFCSPLOWO2_12_FULL_43_9]
MSQHTIVLEKFQGPLDLLLQLIEEKKLEITDIALSQITEQYVRHLEQVEELFPEELADFLVIAAKLLLLKSKILLPVYEEELNEEDLATQLKLFHQFQIASKDIARLLSEDKTLFVAQQGFKLQHVTFAPPTQCAAETLEIIFRAILERLKPAIIIPESSLQRAVSMKEKILHIYAILKQKKTLSLQEYLATNSHTKSDLIVTFLALLELVKQQRIRVWQQKSFTDITIEHYQTQET